MTHHKKLSTAWTNARAVLLHQRKNAPSAVIHHIRAMVSSATTLIEPDHEWLTLRVNPGFIRATDPEVLTKVLVHEAEHLLPRVKRRRSAPCTIWALASDTEANP